MTVWQLHQLLRGLDDGRQHAVSRAPNNDVLHAVWRAAQDEADQRYAGWCEHGGVDAYLSYRAAADRADAALDAMMAQRAQAA
jgi:hypothetical protein